MFFLECEHLARVHSDLAVDIARLDERLSVCSTQDILNPVLVSTFLDLDLNRVSSIFQMLREAGLLREDHAFFCLKCRNTCFLDDHQAALADEGESTCSQCGLILEEKQENLFPVYRLERQADKSDANAELTIDQKAVRRKAYIGSEKRVDEVILLLHGIRTQAEWQDMVCRVLERIPNTTVIALKYGYLDAIRFWCPFWTRRKPISQLVWRIRDAKKRYANARLSVIAHSYGTYAISKILDENPDIEIQRLILCGSILPTTHRWDKMGRQVKSDVINECGIRDIWPVLAESTTWGYGASGTFGFGAPGVHDRFHHCRHSEYFTEAMVSDYWLPWFQRQERVRTGHDKRSPYFWSFLTIVKVKYCVPGLALILAACIAVGYWLLIRVASP